MKRIQRFISMSRLHTALKEICKEEGISLRCKFEQIGLNPSTSSVLINSRPSIKTLRMLCNQSTWKDPKHVSKILQAHLRDEIARSQAGCTNISVSEISAQTVDVQLMDAFALLGKFAKERDSLRELVIDMADAIKTLPR